MKNLIIWLIIIIMWILSAIIYFNNSFNVKEEKFIPNEGLVKLSE